MKKNDRFYGRNSAGKYPLEVAELRTAFNASETIAQRIRSFRADRIGRIYGQETPLPMRESGCIMAHLLPLAAFTEQPGLDLSAYYNGTTHLRPISASGWNRSINLDGFVTFVTAHDGQVDAYTQLFRSGCIEAVMLLPTNESGMYLPSAAYERELMSAFTEYARHIFSLGLEPPVYLFLSLVNVRGCQFGIDSFMFSHNPRPIRERNVLLPEVVLDRSEFQPHSILRPIFDMVWNAFGYERSFNYDTGGNWTGRR